MQIMLHDKLAYVKIEKNEFLQKSKTYDMIENIQKQLIILSAETYPIS